MNFSTLLGLCGGVAWLASASITTGAEENAPAAAPAPVEPAPAVAESDYDRLNIRLGAFLLSSIKTTISLDADGEQVGDDLDFSKDLGGKKSLNVFRADAEWRFARNHRVNFSYFDINLETKHVLERDIEWGGEVYPVSAEVDTQVRTTIGKLSYGYTFYRAKNHEVLGLVGLHITGLQVGIAAPRLGRAERISATAPLPVIGLGWRARISERLYSNVSYEYFGLSLDDTFTGDLSDFQATVDYRLSDHWSLGGGYNRYVLRASVEKERLKLTMKHSYNGLMAYLAVHF
jgi:hypothetical protein